MFPRQFSRLCLAALLSLLASHSLHAGPPTWSKKGRTFPFFCGPDHAPCKPFKVFSPNRKAYLQISYEPVDKDSNTMSASLTVYRNGKYLGSGGTAGLVDNEVVWSPDSKAFFVNGNNNGNGDYHVSVYMLTDADVVEVEVKDAVLADMVRSFPPCRAEDAYQPCKNLESDPDGYIGTAAIDWLPDSSAIVLMAEVTCSSSMGGIMCQVLGYEIEISSGKILRRVEARDFARRWQHSMAWKFHVPDPPEYATN